MFAGFGYAFQTLREQPTVVLTMAAVQLIPILGPISMGGLQAFMFQRLVRRDASPLPPLGADALGPLFKRGLASFLGQFAVGVVVSFLMMVPLLALPLAMVTHDTGAIAVGGGFMVLGVLGAMLLSHVLVTSVLTRAEATEDIEATFSLAPVWDYGRRVWPRVLMSFPALAILTVGLLMLGMACFFVGMYLAMVVIQIAGVHYRWQVYERYLWEGGEPLPVLGTPGQFPGHPAR